MSLETTQLQYSLVCLGYDETKGPPTFQHVIHELALTPFPYAFPEGSGLFLVNGWLDLPETAQCTIGMNGPAGPVLEQRFELKAQLDSRFQLSLLFLDGIAFSSAGDYWVTCTLDGKQYAHYPLVILDAEE